MKAGGGSSLNYHTSFTEEFIAVQGRLGVALDKKLLLLRVNCYRTDGGVNVKYEVRNTKSEGGIGGMK